MTRRRLAFLICPSLHDEVAVLQNGNTKCVLENGRLYDHIETMPRRISDWLRQEYPDNANTNAFCAAIRSYAFTSGLDK